MNVRRSIFVLLFLLCVTTVHAQTDETWSEEQRCLVEPEMPPDDWTYSGTLLLGGAQGILGFNAEWDTRRILAFYPNDTQFLPTPLSPDGRLWVTFQGDSWCSGTCMGTDRNIFGMTVFDLTSPIPKGYKLEWKFWTHDMWTHRLEERNVPVLRWTSPSQFIYIKDPDGFYSGTSEFPVLFDTMTRGTQPYDNTVYNERPFYFHRISPDGTREIHIEYDFDYQLITIFDTQTQTEIAALPEDIEILHYYTTEAWSVDSQYFLGFTSYWKAETDEAGLLLFDREGQMQGTIVQLVEPWLYLDHLEVDWSPDGRYLSLFLDDMFNFGEGSTHYLSLLVDLEIRHIYDLCLKTSAAAAWSQDSKQLALQTTWEGDLTIFEPATWDWYFAEENTEARLTGWQWPEDK